MVRILLRIINVQDDPSSQISTGSSHNVTAGSGQTLYDTAIGCGS
jgi:hypothetical protein